MNRREIIAGLASAAAWPFAALAQQQQPATPVIGLLSGVSFESYADRVAAFRQGLMELGLVEGRNVAIEYRSADGRYERSPALAADLVVDATRKAPATATLTDAEAIAMMKTKVAWTGKYTTAEATAEGIKLTAHVDAASSQAIFDTDRVYLHRWL
jgi:putative ABC transport system substrate-binding protein